MKGSSQFWKISIGILRSTDTFPKSSIDASILISKVLWRSFYDFFDKKSIKLSQNQLNCFCQDHWRGPILLTKASSAWMNIQVLAGLFVSQRQTNRLLSFIWVGSPKEILLFLSKIIPYWFGETREGFRIRTRRLRSPKNESESPNLCSSFWKRAYFTELSKYGLRTKIYFLKL